MCVQVAKFLADPLCRGVFAGDSRVLSMRSCFPILYDLEKEFTSVIIGSLLQKRGWLKYVCMCMCVCEICVEQNRATIVSPSEDLYFGTVCLLARALQATLFSAQRVCVCVCVCLSV